MHQSQILIAHFVSLLVRESLAHHLILLGKDLVSLNHFLVVRSDTLSLLHGLLLLLIDNSFCVLTKLPLLLLVCVENREVMRPFHFVCSKNFLAFVKAVLLLKVFVIFFGSHLPVKVVSVLASMDCLADLFVRLLTIVVLGLSFDYSSPLVDVTISIERIVPLVLSVQVLNLVSFILQRLLHSESVHFQWVDQAHNAFF